MAITAQFAVQTKDPGSAEDYRILRLSSGQLQAGDFGDIFYHFDAGTMPYSAPYPWITYGAVRVGNELFIALIEQKWTDHVDLAGRRFASKTCLAIPYHSLAESAVNFTTLYNMMPPMERLIDRSLPLDLTPDAPSPPIWDKVGRDRFSTAAAAAALLLDSPVALLSSSPLDLQHRLACLDAVASLLPYGLRTELSVATSVDSAVPHEIRLCFTGEARAGQKPLLWDTSTPSPESLNLSSYARAYYDLLINACTRFGPEHLSAYLAAADKREPASFTRPDELIDTLRKLDQPYTLLERVRAANKEHHSYGLTPAPAMRSLGARHHRTPLDNDELVTFLNSGKAAALSNGERLDILEYLLKDAALHRDNLFVVKAHWQPELVPLLFQAGKSSLSLDDEGIYLQELTAVAHEKDQFIPFLYSLLEETPILSSLPRGRAVGLLLQSMKVVEAETDRENPDAHALRDLILTHGPLLYECILQPYSGYTANELPSVLNWLENGSDDAADKLKIFKIAAGLLEEDAQLYMLEALSAHDDEAVDNLILGSPLFLPVLERLLPAVIAWANNHLADFSAARKENWRELLRHLESATDASPTFRAQVTALALLLHPAEPPTFLTSQLEDDPEHFQPYADALTNQITALNSTYRSNLYKHLASARCHSTGCAQNALSLLYSLFAIEQAAHSPQILRFALARFDQHPDLLNSTQLGEGWRALLTANGYAQEVAKLEMSAKFTPETSPDELLRISCETLDAEGPSAAPPLFRAISAKLPFSGSAQLLDYHLALKSALTQNGYSFESLVEVEAALITAALNGNLIADRGNGRTEYQQMLHEILAREALRVGRLLPLLDPPDQTAAAMYEEALKSLAGSSPATKTSPDHEPSDKGTSFTAALKARLPFGKK